MNDQLVKYLELYSFLRKLNARCVRVQPLLRSASEEETYMDLEPMAVMETLNEEGPFDPPAAIIDPTPTHYGTHHYGGGDVLFHGTGADLNHLATGQMGGGGSVDFSHRSRTSKIRRLLTTKKKKKKKKKYSALI
eukprot:Trichotokara_eunicae@DN4650_c0_g1_i7.p1